MHKWRPNRIIFCTLVFKRLLYWDYTVCAAHIVLKTGDGRQGAILRRAEKFGFAFGQRGENPTTQGPGSVRAVGPGTWLFSKRSSHWMKCRVTTGEKDTCKSLDTYWTNMYCIYMWHNIHLSCTYFNAWLLFSRIINLQSASCMQLQIDADDNFLWRSMPQPHHAALTKSHFFIHGGVLLRLFSRQTIAKTTLYSNLWINKNRHIPSTCMYRAILKDSSCHQEH